MDEDDIEWFADSLQTDLYGEHDIWVEIPKEEMKKWETVADIIKGVKKLVE
jgi:acyl carrier protein